MFSRWRESGALVLVLRRRDRVAALVAVVEELDPWAEALAASARRAGTTLVVSGGRGPLARRLGADAMVEGGTGQAEAVRRLQRDGRVVALVTGASEGLVVADLALGVAGQDREVPWAADVLCHGIREVCALLNAVTPARECGVRAARLSVAASVLGGPAPPGWSRWSAPSSDRPWRCAAAVASWSAASSCPRSSWSPPCSYPASAEWSAHGRCCPTSGPSRSPPPWPPHSPSSPPTTSGPTAPLLAGESETATVEAPDGARS
jgi:hypothetical protein